MVARAGDLLSIGVAETTVALYKGLSEKHTFPMGNGGGVTRCGVSTNCVAC